MHTDTVIVGGGLSGLHTAYELQQAKQDFLLIEGRDRLGGRIFSKTFTQDQDDHPASHAAFDLGPTWFWPGQQRMENLINALGLGKSVFKQSSCGHACYEDQQGHIRRGIAGISMAGAYRLKAGIGEIIAGLKSHIPKNKILLSTRLKTISHTSDGLTLQTVNANKQQAIHSKKAVLALPPRVAMKTINFTPALGNKRLSELNNIATWMAGHAKFIAYYSKPFWIQQGLSGDVVSHLGPLHEIHDATSDLQEAAENNVYALFGFVSVPAKHRIGKDREICSAALTQLGKLFGEQALKPLAYEYKDWAADPFTATPADQEMLNYHPHNNLSTTIEPDWNERLLWSGSETASSRGHNNGYLEGALEASQDVLQILKM